MLVSCSFCGSMEKYHFEMKDLFFNSMHFHLHAFGSSWQILRSDIFFLSFSKFLLVLNILFTSPRSSHVISTGFCHFERSINCKIKISCYIAKSVFMRCGTLKVEFLICHLFTFYTQSV